MFEIRLTPDINTELHKTFTFFVNNEISFHFEVVLLNFLKLFYISVPDDDFIYAKQPEQFDVLFRPNTLYNLTFYLGQTPCTN